jgi:hypothetical protein
MTGRDYRRNLVAGRPRHCGETSNEVISDYDKIVPAAGQQSNRKLPMSRD